MRPALFALAAAFAALILALGGLGSSPGSAAAQSAGAGSSAAAQSAGAETGLETGLPLPRWASLGGAPARLRRGPGRRYPTDWVYRRSGLPVMILDEHADWRRLRDWEGSEGWMHKSLLRGSARFIVIAPLARLADRADGSGRIAAELEAGVSGRILGCRSAGGG